MRVSDRWHGAGIAFGRRAVARVHGREGGAGSRRINNAFWFIKACLLTVHLTSSNACLSQQKVYLASKLHGVWNVPPTEFLPITFPRRSQAAGYGGRFRFKIKTQQIKTRLPLIDCAGIWRVTFYPQLSTSAIYNQQLMNTGRGDGSHRVAIETKVKRCSNLIRKKNCVRS